MHKNDLVIRNTISSQKSVFYRNLSDSGQGKFFPITPFNHQTRPPGPIFCHCPTSSIMSSGEAHIFCAFHSPKHRVSVAGLLKEGYLIVCCNGSLIFCHCPTSSIMSSGEEAHISCAFHSPSHGVSVAGLLKEGYLIARCNGSLIFCHCPHIKYHFLLMTR